MAKRSIKHKQRRASSVHESFTDIAMLMLATFIFLLVTILITTRMQETVQVPKLKKEVAELRENLEQAKRDKKRLEEDLGELAGMNVESQMERVLATAGLDKGDGRKDFELFVKGLKELPGANLHLVVDATGSMHGVSTFLVPILRVIVIRSDKDLDAITWFSDNNAETYQGTMGAMLDQLMHGAPFAGSNETIGDAFRRAANNASHPSAYMLIGDEPPDDQINYVDIPSPVFTLPIGERNPNTHREYKKLAEKTDGRMLNLSFR